MIVGTYFDGDSDLVADALAGDFTFELSKREQDIERQSPQPRQAGGLVRLACSESVACQFALVPFDGDQKEEKHKGQEATDDKNCS